MSYNYRDAFLFGIDKTVMYLNIQFILHINSMIWQKILITPSQILYYYNLKMSKYISTCTRFCKDLTNGAGGDVDGVAVVGVGENVFDVDLMFQILDLLQRMMKLMYDPRILYD